jgi:hypothetical protein
MIAIRQNDKTDILEVAKIISDFCLLAICLIILVPFLIRCLSNVFLIPSLITDALDIYQVVFSILVGIVSLFFFYVFLILDKK